MNQASFCSIISSCQFIVLLFRPQRYVFLVTFPRSFFRQRKVQPAVAVNVRRDGDPAPVLGQFRQAELQERIVGLTFCLQPTNENDSKYRVVHLVR